MFAVILILMSLSLVPIRITCGILLSSVAIDRDPDKQIAVGALGLLPIFCIFTHFKHPAMQTQIDSLYVLCSDWHHRNRSALQVPVESGPDDFNW